MKENIIQKKSYDFALQIIKLYQKLCKANEFVLSKQLLRSGTSIGANIEEAQAGQSRYDFISKDKIPIVWTWINPTKSMQRRSHAESQRYAEKGHRLNLLG